MAKKSKFQRNQKKVRKYLKDFNKQLKEDVFAGRFELKQINRKDYQEGAWINYNPDFITIKNWCDPCWRHSCYLIRLIDNEEPERTVEFWAEWSDEFTLVDLTPTTLEARKYLENQGLSSIAWTMNNFIIKSDFWEKWRDMEYKKTHWYTGDELKRMIKLCGDYMITPEAQLEHINKN